MLKPYNHNKKRLITTSLLIFVLLLMFCVCASGYGNQINTRALILFILILCSALIWINQTLKQEIESRQKAELLLKKSESALTALSDQTEQLSLAAAGMISMQDKSLLFQTISNAIVDYSDFQRVIISLFKESFPYRDIVGYAGIEKEKIDQLRTVEFPKTWYDGVFSQGVPIGQLSYYIPHTMKHILNQDAIYYGKGPLPQIGEAWHPEDNLFVRMNDEKGQFIGVISVDESKSGEIPSDRTIRPLEIFSSLISQIIILKREQEQRLKAESHLHQAIKMESVGTLAGGIAHNFNNIMGIILGNTELALEDVQESHPAHSRLKEIQRAGLRAADIVKQLLNFSSKTDHQLSPLKIVPILDETLGLLKSSIPTTIEIHRQYMDMDATVIADSVQIRQALMNLFINACQSMTNGKGCVEITVQKGTVTEPDTDNRPEMTPERYIKITISDTGSGISPTAINRVFDPYFTTKEMGKGSGMGLAIVAGIIKSHQGTILVNSTPGLGSRFSIFLPQADQPAEKRPAEPSNGQTS